MKPFGNRFARLTACLFLTAGLAGAASGASAVDAESLQLLQRAAGDDVMRRALAGEGRATADFCTNCHGEAGISRYPDVPNLAGQHPAYLLKQIEAFRTGKRKNDFMEGLMKVLQERDKAAIALHFSALPPTPALPAAGPRAKEGAALFAEICARCHQPDARGTELVPRLAGQQPDYLRRNLRRYLTQSGERFYAPMTAAVIQLGEHNIEAVVDYLGALR